MDMYSCEDGSMWFVIGGRGWGKWVVKGGLFGGVWVVEVEGDVGWGSCLRGVREGRLCYGLEWVG